MPRPRRKQATPRRGPDAKPRLRSDTRGPAKRAGMRRRAVKQLSAINVKDMMKTTGGFAVADRTPTGTTSGVIYGATGPQGGISVNPAHRIAWRIRKALNPRTVLLSRRPDCTVYDAAGQPVAVIDGETRVRRALASPPPGARP